MRSGAIYHSSKHFVNEIVTSTSGLVCVNVLTSHEDHASMIICISLWYQSNQLIHAWNPVIRKNTLKLASCISNVLGRKYELWLLLSRHFDIQQEMSDRLPSSYHSVFNNTWANSECLHDKCDHLMSLRLIKRLSHLTGDGENVMK